MATTVNIHEAKTNLSRLLVRVQTGEEVIIARAGHPVAKLVPIKRRGARLGWAKGEIWIADDFDETPPEILAALDEPLDAFKRRK